MRFDFRNNKFAETESAGDAPFVIGSDKTISEKEVLAYHQKLCSLIRSLNIPAGHVVCIYGEKEALFPVAMISLMTLDIPYVPIDVIMPEGRIEKIKEQTGSQVVINCSDKICEVAFECVIDKNFDLVSSKLNGVPITLSDSNDPLRYILFTSGSTGVPKGVQITASALNSFADWYLTWPLINKDAVFMNQAPFSFDVSLCDLIGAFANGSKLILNNYVILKNGNLFLERLRENKVNTLVCTPAFIQMYLSVPEFNENNYPQLRQIVFMGEELHAANVKKLKRLFPSLKVINAYGPTEATVVVTYIEITNEILHEHSKSLPIGYIRPGGEMVVINKDESTGIGELGICGPSLSTGYLNDAEKTQKAFIEYRGRRVYKTGDVGFIKDGIIFYLGRNDSQVKLNGYRIELDEISNVLLNHSLVKDAAVIPLANNNVTKKIICFVIPSGENAFNDLNAELKDYLLKYLPAYMVPSEFIARTEFPLNANYKTDKKALLEIYLNA